jgi:hypothetical protein
MIGADRLRRRHRRRRVGTFALMILAASLAGCLEPTPAPQALRSAGPAPNEAAAPPALVAASEPAIVAAVMPPAEAAVPASPARPAAPPRPPAPSDPRRLIGLTQERIESMLGPADFVRRDGPAQIWRYDTEDCSLDVFLFREGEIQRVTHVASRARKVDGPDVALNACYARVLGMRRTSPAS